jgi:hypothetical protein
MQWAPHNQRHSPPYPPHHPTQAYQNSQTQSSAYYQLYHYATTNHPQPPPTPQITYHHALPQITYPTPSNTNTNTNEVKVEPNPTTTSTCATSSRTPATTQEFFPPTVPYSQSTEVQTQTSKPKGSTEIIITKLTMSLSKVPSPKLNGPICQ